MNFLSKVSTKCTCSRELQDSFVYAFGFILIVTLSTTISEYSKDDKGPENLTLFHILYYSWTNLIVLIVFDIISFRQLRLQLLQLESQQSHLRMVNMNIEKEKIWNEDLIREMVFFLIAYFIFIIIFF